MTDVLAAIDAALDDHQATTGQIGEDHYREAMESVRDLLDGAHGIGNSEMHWAPRTAFGDRLTAAEEAFDRPGALPERQDTETVERWLLALRRDYYWGAG